MANEFHLKGAEQALAKIRSVREDIAKKGLRSAGTRAMKIVRDAARRGAAALDDPESASNIAKNIVTRYDGRGSKREGGVVVKVGVMGGATPKPGREDTGHWRLLEFGTSDTPATPFMRPALENNVQQVADTFISEVSTQIDKAVAKAKR